MPHLVKFAIGGKRERVSAEEAQAALKHLEELIVEEQEVEYFIDISCKQWNQEALNIMRPAFQQVASRISVLKIDDIIAALMTDEGLELMGIVAEIFAPARETIRVLDISDNAMGPRALERMKSLLSAPKLEELVMSNCGLSAETIVALDDALKIDGEGPGFARLQTLVLDRNMLGVEGAKQLSTFLPSCVKLRRLSFRGCRPNKEGSGFITKALRDLAENNEGKHMLSEIGLMDCTLGSGEEEDDPIHDFAKALEKCPLLTHLDIEDCGDLNEQGCGLIGQAVITANAKIVELSMGGGCLGPDGAEALQEALKANLMSTKTLQFRTAELEDEGVASIVGAFEGEDNVLEVLRLDENELGEAALDALIGANFPNLRMLSLMENLDLEDFDDKKQALRDKFPKARVCFDEDDQEEEVAEDKDDDVDALTAQLKQL